MTKEELKESGKKYYLNNREKIIKRVVNYQKFNTNPEKKLKRKEYLKAHGAAYYIKNKDKMINNYKEYYMNNSDKVKEYQKEYYMNNSDKVKEYQKAYREKRREEKIRIKEKSLAYQNSIMNDYHIHKNKYYEFCI
jgi:hypothetical protein